jgi:hypothetical protein
MNKLLSFLSLLSNELILVTTIFIVSFVLNLLGKLNQQYFLFINLFIIAYLTIRFLLVTYLNFILAVRNQQSFLPDNRTANFMTFDMLKFVLILIALISIVVLGLNRILNNETIATLLGGLVGSLLTIKGSYSDLKFDKETLDKLGQTPPTKPSE